MQLVYPSSYSTGSGMLGGWWFGCSPSSPDSNFLRVGNVFPNRRLSDNTLMTPKIRIAPSCASSPGGTPGSGLPTRRHSSIGPQERRGSTINLSPPTVSCFLFYFCSLFYLLPSLVLPLFYYLLFTTFGLRSLFPFGFYRLLRSFTLALCESQKAFANILFFSHFIFISCIKKKL